MTNWTIIRCSHLPLRMCKYSTAEYDVRGLGINFCFFIRSMSVKLFGGYARYTKQNFFFSESPTSDLIKKDQICLWSVWKSSLRQGLRWTKTENFLNNIIKLLGILSSVCISCAFCWFGTVFWSLCYRHTVSMWQEANDKQPKLSNIFHTITSLNFCNNPTLCVWDHKHVGKRLLISPTSSFYKHPPEIFLK